MTQATLFDTLPAEPPSSSVPTTVFDECNRRHGHLLIEAKGLGDYVFLNLGNGRIQFGLMGSDTYVVGDYCHRMAEQIEAAHV